MVRMAFAALCAGTLAVLVGCGSAFAELKEVRIAKQYGISYLPLMLMEADQLFEKKAKEAGLDAIKVEWSTFAWRVSDE